LQCGGLAFLTFEERGMSIIARNELLAQLILGEEALVQSLDFFLLSYGSQITSVRLEVS
jgi:hypothetical protein